VPIATAATVAAIWVAEPRQDAARVNATLAEKAADTASAPTPVREPAQEPRVESPAPPVSSALRQQAAAPAARPNATSELAKGAGVDRLERINPEGRFEARQDKAETTADANARERQADAQARDRVAPVFETVTPAAPAAPPAATPAPPQAAAAFPDGTPISRAVRDRLADARNAMACRVSRSPARRAIGRWRRPMGNTVDANRCRLHGRRFARAGGLLDCRSGRNRRPHDRWHAVHAPPVSRAGGPGLDLCHRRSSRHCHVSGRKNLHHRGPGKELDSIVLGTWCVVLSPSCRP
jgi:hypothetical protein